MRGPRCPSCVVGWARTQTGGQPEVAQTRRFDNRELENSPLAACAGSFDWTFVAKEALLSSTGRGLRRVTNGRTASHAVRGLGW
jgi:hypothetical protein